jgi:hypothetical protein
VHKIKVWVGGATNGRVVPLALRVVFALDNVEGEGALVAGDAIGAVVVEEEVTDPKSAQLANAEAADGGEARGEPVPMVGQGGRSPRQETMNHGPVNGMNERAGCSLERAQDASPGREFVGSVDGWAKSS